MGGCNIIIINYPKKKNGTEEGFGLGLSLTTDVPSYNKVIGCVHATE